MKYYFDGIIVVEGKDDVAFLSSFIDSMYVTTRGYVIPKEEIDFIAHIGNKQIIILTDSDQAGEEIRNRLNQCLISAINVKLDITLCNKNNKHGVAEAEKSEVLSKLKQYLKAEPNKKENVCLADIENLGINTKQKRENLCTRLHLGLCNTKTMINRINYKELTKEEIKKQMESSNGN